jgi:TRAP-type uncharacterized transport system fused permease subunit
MASVLVISLLKKAKRPSFRKMLNIFEGTGEGMLEICVVAAAAGLLIGVITLTGLGFFSTPWTFRALGAILILILFTRQLLPLKTRRRKEGKVVLANDRPG